MRMMRAFLVFLFAYILSQFFRSFLAVIAPELSGELSLGPQALANMQASWIWAFVAMQFPVGWALDTVGPRRTVTATMLAAIAGAAVFAYAGSALHLYAAMALIGAGCSAMFMAALYVFGREHPPERFAVLTSTLIGIGSAGNLLAATPLAWAASEFGWRNTMLAIAAASAVSAILVWTLIRDPERIGGQSPRGLFAGIGDVFKIRALWPLLPLTATGYALMLAERGLWAGPYFAEVHGLEPVARGNALLAMAAAMSLGALAYGPLDRIFGTRKWVVFGGSSITAACFLALGFFDVPLAAAIALMAALGFFGLTYAVLMAHGRSFIPDHLLGRGITALNALFIGGAGILQPVSGAIAARLKAEGAPPESVYSALHTGFGLVLAASLVFYFFSREKAAT
jgi:predicted MFS family arabinose efflux permease